VKAYIITYFINIIIMLAPLLGAHTPLAPASPATITVAPSASKCYQLICDPRASCWLHTLANLSNVVYVGKKLNAVVGLTGPSFLALKVAMIAGAVLSISSPPLSDWGGSFGYIHSFSNPIFSIFTSKASFRSL